MSDSEEAFESADEGSTFPQKTKKDKTPLRQAIHKIKAENEVDVVKSNEQQIFSNKSEGWEDDNWDDFDIDNSESPKPSLRTEFIDNNTDSVMTNQAIIKSNNDEGGWDDFDNWENDDVRDTSNTNSDLNDGNEAKNSLQEHSEKEYKELADRLSSMSNSNSGGNSGWGGWSGWGVTNLLTSGVSQLTSHVTQGFASVSQVIESGISIPDPEELAQSQLKEKERQSSIEDKTQKIDNISESFKKENEPNFKDIPNIETSSREDNTMNVFKIGKLVSNVTKLVESTGSAVVTGGLDTLEEIGKRTMRVLQGEDEGKKRLSTLLKEARDRIDDQYPVINAEQTIVKKAIPKFESLFDDFQGLVHLEALEMLSKQCDMKLQTLLTTYEGQELTDLKETLDQVKEICELPDSDEDEDKDDNRQFNSEVLRNKLITSIKDLGIQIQFESIIKCWENIIIDANNKDYESIGELDDEMEKENAFIEKAEGVMIIAFTSLAETSALSVQILHRSTALLSVRERRSTADEADGLTQLTAALTSHIGEVAALYSQKLNEICKLCKNSEKINSFITNVFLEAGKGSSYVQDAFLLTIPILQVGAT